MGNFAGYEIRFLGTVTAKRDRLRRGSAMRGNFERFSHCDAVLISFYR
jgi:hypothetical protein